MAWSDKPTDSQLNVICQWLKWETALPTGVIPKALTWLEENATRGDVAREMTRLKKLKDRRQLNGENCFDSEIWEGFKEVKNEWN